MSKAASVSTKGTSSSKKTATSKARASKAQPGVPASAAPEAPPENVALAVESAAPISTSEARALTSILQRLDALEEKITGGFTVLTEELRPLHVAPLPAAVEPGTTPEAVMSLLADVLRHNLMEHLTPVTAALKRLEERIGFVANRLKFSGGGGGGQDRQKPWRGEQGRHPRPPRGQQNGQQRQAPPQPQQWTPPSAASVQGHFAPRPTPARGFVEEDD